MAFTSMDNLYYPPALSPMMSNNRASCCTGNRLPVRLVRM
jgi:hypothetical protein